jgi:predicted transcriptional regulator
MTLIGRQPFAFQDIADRLGRARSTVSMYLSGERTAPARLFDVIAELTDEATAKRVARAIGVPR